MNHTLSDSQLEAMIKSAVNSSGPLPPDEKFSQLISALRELQERRKAAMDSEPVAWRWRWSDDAEGYWRYTEEQRETRGSVTAQPLYRHAQPAPVVPEDIPDSVYEILCQACGGKAWMYEEALWNACRAAMLNHPSSIQPNTDAAPGAEIKHPSTNSPVIPEGYVMVPKEPTAQMYDAGDRQMTTKQVWDAMLAAAPQEAK